MYTDIMFEWRSHLFIFLRIFTAKYMLQIKIYISLAHYGDRRQNIKRNTDGKPWPVRFGNSMFFGILVLFGISVLFGNSMDPIRTVYFYLFFIIFIFIFLYI